MERQLMTTQILRSIQARGGRFLRPIAEDAVLLWEVMDDGMALTKIAKAFDYLAEDLQKHHGRRGGLQDGAWGDMGDFFLLQKCQQMGCQPRFCKTR